MLATSIAALAVTALFTASPAASDAPSPYQAAVHLSGKIGSRPSTSGNERRAHQYVARQFRASGLDVEVDSFRVPGRGQSRDVIGKLDRPGSCLVILMSHTDSVPRGTERSTTPRASGCWSVSHEDLPLSTLRATSGWSRPARRSAR